LICYVKASIYMAVESWKGLVHAKYKYELKLYEIN